MRSGSAQAEKYARFAGFVRPSADFSIFRVKALEGQISELEAEASRLLRALDTAKEARTEAERTEKRKSDEAAKDSSMQVCWEYLKHARAD